MLYVLRHSTRRPRVRYVTPAPGSYIQPQLRHQLQLRHLKDELQEWLARHRPVDAALAKERRHTPKKKVQLKCPPGRARDVPTKVQFKNGATMQQVSIPPDVEPGSVVEVPVVDVVVV